MHRIAIIGSGNICRHILNSLLATQALRDKFKLAVLARSHQPAVPLPEGADVFTDIDAVLAWQPDLVVEAASQGAVREYGEKCLEAGVSFLITSTGALADTELAASLAAHAQAGGCRIIIPSGAIGGLDYIQGAARFPDAEVTYESRKPPAAWLPELEAMGIAPAAVSEPIVLFSGPASEAAARYPKNLNVAATLAQAGVGMTATQVQVIVDPQSPGNQHVIHVKSAAGTFSLSIVNKPSPDNPKTSWIVAENIVATTCRYFSPCWMG
ncbi:MAG TPA: aspartate dehydrogenase [Candidimonas sp.]|nr:aspartate dehydrogenase [Candidimonas sp.]